MNVRPFCPKCGRESKGLCVDCYLEDNPVTLKDFKISYCECGQVKFQDVWRSDVNAALLELVESKIRYPEEFEKPKASLEVELEVPTAHVKVLVEAVYGGESFGRGYEWDIPVVKMICPHCAKHHSRYFEAILQVRSSDFDYDSIDEKQIVNMEFAKGGKDVFLIDAGYARQFTRQLADKGYLIVASNKLFGKKDGRDTYRHFFSIKKPGFGVGDFITFNKGLYRVLKYGSQLYLLNVRDLSTVSRRMSLLRGLEVAAKKDDVRKARVSEVRPDGIQVMDSKSLELYDFKNKGFFRQGDEVELLEFMGVVYLLPILKTKG